jgi:hypothetical protein
VDEKKDEVVVEPIVDETEIQMEPEVKEEVKPTQSKKSKLAEAQELIESSKELVSKADSEVEECKVGVSQAAEDFDNAKHAFNNGVFASCEASLEKTGFEYTPYDEEEPFELAIDDENEEKFSVDSLSTGRFTGLILSILAALATVVAWIYLAMNKLNINPSELTIETAMNQINPVLTWIGGEIIGAKGNMIIGALVIGFSALIMAWFIYALRVNMKAKKNLVVAKEMYDKSSEYCMNKEECRREMKRVDAHLREATQEIGNIDTVLNEKLSTLKRILHVEGPIDEEKEYHPSSKKEMRETEKIMRGIEKLLNTAITKNGKLNFQSVQALNNARAIYADYLARIYD